ncbi:MAG: GumC family protein, partial [Candidatus Woesearchaeota archaeon]
YWNNNMKEEEIDIYHYIKLLRMYWILAFIMFLLVFGAVIAYTYLSAPVYEAKSLVAITTQDQTSFLLGSTAPKVSDLETQKLVILSSNVMNKIYAEYGVDTFTPSVNIIKNSNAIEITVETTGAADSALIANNIAESYLEYTREMRKQDATAVITFVNDQIEQYDAELDMLNDKIIDYEAMGKSISASQKIEYQATLRELNAKNKIYDYLLNKREEAGLVASLNSGNVNILSYASLPGAPIKPNIPLNIMLGFILAVGAALGSVLVFDKM